MTCGWWVTGHYARFHGSLRCGSSSSLSCDPTVDPRLTRAAPARRYGSPMLPEQITKLAIALGGLPVLGCRPGSPAARAGIRYGDVLLAVNGVPTPDWKTYVQARAIRERETEIAIFRAGD